MNIGEYIINKDRTYLGIILYVNENSIIAQSRGIKNIINTVDEFDSSNNIIDLIRVGDIVNGYTIEKITTDVISGRKKLLTGHWQYNFQGDGTLLQFYNEDIISVETKEMSMSNSYDIKSLEVEYEENSSF